MFSTHGVSPQVRGEARRRGLHAIDATCPLVAKVHAEARRFAGAGYLVALIGHGGHEEVEGTLGEAPASIVLVETVDDVAKLRPADPGKVAYLMQTTLAADEADEIADAIRDRFPAAKGPGGDGICYATTNRQRAPPAVVGTSWTRCRALARYGLDRSWWPPSQFSSPCPDSSGNDCWRASGTSLHKWLKDKPGGIRPSGV